MITCEYELADRIEELRRDTLSTIWKEPAQNTPSKDLVEELTSILKAIKQSSDGALRKRAASVIENLVDIDVHCDPYVDINF